MLQGQEYAGHLCLNQKEAVPRQRKRNMRLRRLKEECVAEEKSAAEQAVMAFRPQMATLPPPASKAQSPFLKSFKGI